MNNLFNEWSLDNSNCEMQTITTATYHLEAVSVVITKMSKENESKIETLSQTLLKMNSKLDETQELKFATIVLGSDFFHDIILKI